jgi:hypothetical protein
MSVEARLERIEAMLAVLVEREKVKESRNCSESVSKPCHQ